MTVIDPNNTQKKESLSALATLGNDVMEGADQTEAIIEPTEDGGVVVTFAQQEEEEDEYLDFTGDSDEHYENLVEYLDQHQLNEIGSMVLANVDADEAARSEWMRTIDLGLELLGIKIEEKSEPFEGACSAQHPLLMESAVKFQSKASNELLPNAGPVKTKILGDVSVEKEQQANRVKAHMNYQITELMTEFYTDSERMLLYLPLVGSAFKKTYYSSHLERPVSEFVPADQFIVPNNASDLHRADRYTHVLIKSGYDLEADCAAGLYKKPDNGFVTSGATAKETVSTKAGKLAGFEISMVDKDCLYTLYEQHIMLCIDGLDKYEGDKADFDLASPYIVTVESSTGNVIGLRRNWKKGDVKRRKKVNFSHFQFVPSFTFYGYGFLHLLGNLQLSLTSALRTLIDAGQFATLQGGFKLKGVRINDDGRPIQPGQFKEIETIVQDINKAIMPLPFKEPSQTLYAMLEFLDKKGQKFADSTEQVLADATNYGPVGTTMALLDASTKFFSAIHKRLHNSLKQELRIIADINAETLDDNVEYNLENMTMKVSRDDYDSKVDIVPVSDPNISSNAHRMTKAQNMLEMAMRAPQLHDMREVYKHVYVNMDYINVDKIMPPPEEAAPNPPLVDIQLVSQGKPIKAFPGQDHKAHIALKQAFLQDPMSGQNPMMQQIAVAIQANIQEHMMLSFMEQIKAQAEMSGAPEEQAAQQVAMMNQQALQAQMEAQQQSPRDQAAILLAQAELMDSQTQAEKMQFDKKFKVADLELKKERLDMDKVKEINRADEKRLDLTNKIGEIVQTAGLDAMIKGLSSKHDVTMAKIKNAHEKDLALLKVNESKQSNKPKPRTSEE